MDGHISEKDERNQEMKQVPERHDLDDYSKPIRIDNWSVE
jgi:hypothetical protein